MPNTPYVDAASLRDAERELDDHAGPGQYLDLTYADTCRFPPPDWAVDTFVDATGTGMAYTPYRGDAGIRSLVAQSTSALLGTHVDPERQLVLTPGSQAALFAAMAALVEPDTEVLLPDPDYLASERLLRYHGARITRVPLRWEMDGEPQIDLDHVEERFAHGARVLLFSHPNNPTGAVYRRETIEELARIVERHDALVVVDELYCRLVFDEVAFPHLAAHPAMSERCLTLLGPSKTESMSGYRIGAAVGPAWLIDAMEDVISIAALRAPAYAQHLLGRWLNDDREFVRERVADYQRLRDVTVETLRASGLFEVCTPRGSAYAFPRVTRTGASEQTVALALKSEAGLMVNPGYQFGAAWRGHFRICFAQEEHAWEKALDKMIATIARL